MVVGPFIAIIAAFGGPLATERERVQEISTAPEPREEISESTQDIFKTPEERIGERIDDPDQPLFDPIPSPDFSEISGGGPEDTTEFVVFKEEKAPIEVKEEIGEEFISGGMVTLSQPLGEGDEVFGTAGSLIALAEETTLDAGQLAVAARTADLLGISLEESIQRLEEQLAAQPGFTPPTTTFKFSVGQTVTYIKRTPIRGLEGSHFLITATPATTEKFRFGGEPIYDGRFVDGPWAGKNTGAVESDLQA